MRVMVNIEGRVSVHEILEFEPQEDGTVLMTTPDDAMDLVVNNMNQFRMESVCRELLKLGYADISEYETVYDDVFEDEYDDDDELKEYSTICPVCDRAFGIHMSPQAAEKGMIICPHCGEELEFEMYDDCSHLRLVSDDDENALAYETTCPQCHMTIDVSQKDVDAGNMTCPICKANLEFDAIDAENQTLGNYDDDEDNYGEEDEG